MTIQIQLSCQDGTIGCILTSLISLISLIITIGSGYSIYKLHQFQKNNKEQFVYEYLPIITCFFESFLHLIFNFFIQQMEILLVCLYIQTCTIAIVAFSFIFLYYQSQNMINIKRIKRLKVYVAVFIIISIGFMIASITGLTGIGCDTWLKFDIIVPFVLSLIFIIFCAVYGLCLYKLINNKHLTLSGFQKKQKNDQIEDENNNNKNNSGLDTTPFLSHKQQFYRQQEKQILFVIICFSSIWLGEFIMYILQLVLMEDKLICDNEKTLIIANDQGGEIFLFVFSVLQLLPSTIIPYIFYYLPYVNQKKGKKYDLISLGKVSFSQEEQNFNFDDNNQNQNKNINSNEQFIQSTQVISQKYENEDDNETHESYDNYDYNNIGSNQNKQQSNQLIKKANKTTYDNLQQTEFNYNYNYDELFK